MEGTYENATYSESSKQMPEKKSVSHRWLIILLTLTFVALLISIVAIISVFIFRNSSKFTQVNSDNVTEALRKFEAQIDELKQLYAECAHWNDVLESRLNVSLKAVHSIEEVQSQQNRSIDAVEVKISDLETRQTQQEARVTTSVNSLNHTVETNMAEIELALTDIETQQSQQERRVMTSFNSLNNTIRANMAEVELELKGFETQQSQLEARIMASVNSLSSTVEQHHAEGIYLHVYYKNFAS